MNDRITVRCAWSAVEVLALDSRLSHFVAPSAAGRMRVNPQPGARCVMISGSPIDLQSLASEMWQLSQWANPRAARAGRVIAAKIERTIRESAAAARQGAGQ